MDHVYRFIVLSYKLISANDQALIASSDTIENAQHLVIRSAIAFIESTVHNPP